MELVWTLQSCPSLLLVPFQLSPSCNPQTMLPLGSAIVAWNSQAETCWDGGIPLAQLGWPPELSAHRHQSKLLKLLLNVSPHHTRTAHQHLQLQLMLTAGHLPCSMYHCSSLVFRLLIQDRRWLMARAGHLHCLCDTVRTPMSSLFLNCYDKQEVAACSNAHYARRT